MPREKPKQNIPTSTTVIFQANPKTRDKVQQCSWKKQHWRRNRSDWRNNTWTLHILYRLSSLRRSWERDGPGVRKISWGELLHLWNILLLFLLECMPFLRCHRFPVHYFSINVWYFLLPSVSCGFSGVLPTYSSDGISSHILGSDTGTPRYGFSDV